MIFNPLYLPPFFYQQHIDRNSIRYYFWYFTVIADKAS
ncbi:hypothetical protein [Clostridium phage Villandry]|nr:hypothetical protein [Clostridium phage Villandry]